MFLVVLFGIIYFSNVSNLIVSDPNTWVGKTEYENVQDLYFLLDGESLFYENYGEHKGKDFYMHKLGHIIAYSLLTLTFWINLKKKSYIKTIFFIVFFAFTDEIHQFFIVGRSGRLLDVLLDITASLLTLIIISILRKKN